MRSSGALIAAIIVLAASPALAEPAAGTVSGTSAPRRDGFYLRLGFGYGGHVETAIHMDTDETAPATGWARVGELAIGTAVRPGLVIGGGLWTSTVVSYETSLEGEVPDEVARGGRDYHILGSFIDWYPDPGRGLHVQGALGVATTDDSYSSSSSIGGGLIVGAGYEWPVVDKISLGVMVRVGGAVTYQDADASGEWMHVAGFSPSVLFTATYL